MITIDKLSDLDFYYVDDYCVVNLNNVVLFPRMPFIRLNAVISEIVASKRTTKINLCNFCSLLLKFGYEYSSPQAYKLLRNIVRTIKRVSPKVQLVQNRVNNNGEFDIEPLISLIKLDRISETILIHSCIQKQLNVIGFADIQLAEAFETPISLVDLIPQDLLKPLPIFNKTNYMAWCKLKKLLEMEVF